MTSPHAGFAGRISIITIHWSEFRLFRKRVPSLRIRWTLLIKDATLRRPFLFFPSFPFTDGHMLRWPGRGAALEAGSHLISRNVAGLDKDDAVGLAEERIY